MTDNIRTNFCATCKEQADRIEALSNAQVEAQREITALKDALAQVGSELGEEE